MEIYYSFIEPFMGIFFSRKDNTYGRKSLPLNKAEVYLRTLVDDGVIEHEEHYLSLSSYTIYYQTWFPKHPKCHILHLHGLNDYGGRFAEYVKPYLDAGVAVTCIDLYGYGRSDGLHSYTPSYDILLENVSAVFKEVKRHERLSKMKHFLQGGSMGGNLAINYHVQNPNEEIHGLILLCPMIFMRELTPFTRILKLIARVVRYIVPRVPSVYAGNI
jgi:alpha-beta hydrolase superfamily lysophospholipase